MWEESPEVTQLGRTATKKIKLGINSHQCPRQYRLQWGDCKVPVGPVDLHLSQRMLWAHLWILQEKEQISTIFVVYLYHQDITRKIPEVLGDLAIFIRVMAGDSTRLLPLAVWEYRPQVKCPSLSTVWGTSKFRDCRSKLAIVRKSNISVAAALTSRG